MSTKLLIFMFIIGMMASRPIHVNAATGVLPPEEFLKHGAGIVVGEIVGIDILRQDESVEEGNIVFKIESVLKGEVDKNAINFSYKRQLGPVIVGGDAWDLVPPERGKKVIIFFKMEDDAFVAHPAASNSIEEIDSYDDARVEALGKIVNYEDLKKGAKKFNALNEGLKSEGNPDVRAYCIRALSLFEKERKETSPIFVRIFLDSQEDINVRYQAGYTLRTKSFDYVAVEDKINNDIIAGFVEGLKDERAGIRIQSIDALEFTCIRKIGDVETKDTSILPYLDDVLGKETDERVLKRATDVKAKLKSK